MPPSITQKPYSVTVFTMEYYRFQRICSEAMGTFMVPGKNTQIRQLQSSFNLLCTFVLLLTTVTTFVQLFPDFLLMSDPLMFSIGILLSMIRHLSYHIRSKDFEQLYSAVLELDSKTKRSERVVLKSFVDFSQFLSKINLSFIQFGSMIGLYGPLILPTYRNWKGFDVQWPIPFNLYLPFDVSSNFRYIAL